MGLLPGVTAPPAPPKGQGGFKALYGLASEYVKEHLTLFPAHLKIFQRGPFPDPTISVQEPHAVGTRKTGFFPVVVGVHMVPSLFVFLVTVIGGTYEVAF